MQVHLKNVASRRGRKRRSEETDLQKKKTAKVESEKKPKSQKTKDSAQKKREGGTRRKGRRRRRRRQSSGSEDEDEDSCAADGCLQPSGENVDWVQCDGGCDKWFHMACVGLSAEDICEDEDYICITCSQDNYSSLNTMETSPPVNSDCSNLAQPSTSKDSAQCNF